MSSTMRLAIIGAVALIAAIVGVVLGRVLIEPPRQNETELHALMHRELSLTAEQEARLDAIEARYTGQREALELELRAANIRLAQAIEAEHGYGPRVTRAVDDMHMTMGALQKETLRHLFAMRSVLDEDQAAMFDRVVVKALTDEPR
ncbi:periplasmic heavy metal sensor [Tsuneonella sp. HG094]